MEQTDPLKQIVLLSAFSARFAYVSSNSMQSLTVEKGMFVYMRLASHLVLLDKLKRINKSWLRLEFESI